MQTNKEILMQAIEAITEDLMQANMDYFNASK